GHAARRRLGPIGPSRPCFRASLARGADAVADAGERLVRVRAQGGDRRDAHHDNKGQHNGVLNCRRAVFLREEVLHAIHKLTHYWGPFEKPVSRKSLGQLGQPIYVLPILPPRAAGPWRRTPKTLL